MSSVDDLRYGQSMTMMMDLHNASSMTQGSFELFNNKLDFNSSYHLATGNHSAPFYIQNNQHHQNGLLRLEASGNSRLDLEMRSPRSGSDRSSPSPATSVNSASVNSSGVPTSPQLSNKTSHKHKGKYGFF